MGNIFWQCLFIVVYFLSLTIPLLLSVAFLTLVERKILAAMQRRLGPNMVGFMGLLQPLADGVKLLIKESVVPAVANRMIFLLSPVLTFFLSLVSWAVVPLGPNSVFADINLGVLFIFAVSSLGVYGIVMAGWASNSRYAFLGALRSAAQMVSYEISIGLIIITIVICVGSLNLYDIVFFQRHVYFIVPFLPLLVLFFVSALAETNRPPFDLPEAEGELVAGYSVEYSAAAFALFFIGEYANIILMAVLCSVFFCGGWLPVWPFSGLLGSSSVWLVLKTLLFLFLFVWVRAAYPRYRYDQLMRLGWKVFLPLSLGWVVLVSGVLLAFGWAPYSL